MTTSKNKWSLSLRNSSPDSKADFSQNFSSGIWRSILSAWHIKFYLTYNITFLIYERPYFEKVLNKQFIGVNYIEFPIRILGFPGEIPIGDSSPPPIPSHDPRPRPICGFGMGRGGVGGKSLRIYEYFMGKTMILRGNSI